MKTLVSVHLVKILFFLWALGALAALTSSCACSTPDQRNSLQCVVEHAVVDCTESTVVSQAPGFLPFAAELIDRLTGAGGSFDVAAFESALAGLGLRDAGCIAAELDAALGAAGPTAAPDRVAQASNFHGAVEAYLAKKFPAGTRFRLRDGRLR